MTEDGYPNDSHRQDVDTRFHEMLDAAIETAREQGLPEILIADQLFYVAMKLAVECQGGGSAMSIAKAIGLAALVEMRMWREGSLREVGRGGLRPVAYDGLEVLSPFGQIQAVESTKRACRAAVLEIVEAHRGGLKAILMGARLCNMATRLVRKSGRQGADCRDWEVHYEQVLNRVMCGELFHDDDLLREIADRNLNVSTGKPRTREDRYPGDN